MATKADFTDEEWTIGADGRIAESRGHYDQAEYDRQLREGAVVA